MEKLRLFNGKSWDEMSRLLTEPFPADSYRQIIQKNGKPKLKMDGSPVLFLSRNTCDKRLRDTLGIGCFSFSPAPLPDGVEHIMEVKEAGGEPCTYITMSARLDVFDDDGVLKVTSFGVASVVYRGDYNNDLGSAYSRACKLAELALFMIDDDEADDSRKSYQVTSGVVPDSNPVLQPQTTISEQQERPLETMEIVVTEALVLANKAYRGKCSINGEDYPLVLWETSAAKLAEKYKCDVVKVLDCLEVGKRLKIKATKDEFRNQIAITIRGFVKK